MKKILIGLFLFPVYCLLGSGGLEYTHLELPTSSYFSFLTGNQSIHVLEIDPNLYEIKPIKALDNGIGRESVLSIARRYGAVASINGGFFSIGGTLDGRGCGALKIGEWYALPFKPRGSIGWRADDPSPKFDRLAVNIEGYYGLSRFSIQGLNRGRKEGEAILYTPCFHRTTLTDREGEEIVVVNEVIHSISRGGSSKIPENGFVFSVHQTNPLFGSFEVGKSFSFKIETTPLTGATISDQWEGLNYIVGGTPLLIHHGARVLDYESEQTLSTFLSNKHARTAVGILPDGRWLFVVVDKVGIFDGMTVYELADLMERLGCIDALNLDGGGSSTLVYEGVVQNSPRGDEDEGRGEGAFRRVSDAIVVCLKKGGDS